MKRKIITTADGSTTIHLPEWDEHYHSKHGAIQEAYHVFIEAGLGLFSQGSLAILEIGFGTGLNALITLMEAQKRNLKIAYTGVEKYPVPSVEIAQLNYLQELDAATYEDAFKEMHQCAWGKSIHLTPYFSLQKQHKDFMEISDEQVFNLIYFDAFGARVQPELWTVTLFSKMFNALKPNGILVTYAAKGSVRRAMQEVGFSVERLAGPPGKREMLRATKV